MTAPPPRHEDHGRSAGHRFAVSDLERQRRWRLVLGSASEEALDAQLDVADRGKDRALQALYDLQPDATRRDSRRASRARRGSLDGSAPTVARWLGDIRTYFPRPVVQVMQRDAIERLDLRQLLLEPELLDNVEPDIHLAAMLVELNHLLPEQTKATARQVVARVLSDIERRLADQTRVAVRGALARSERVRRPRPGDIDLNRTVRQNLRHYQPDQRTIIAERLVGFGRRQRSLSTDIVIAIDQSASMADSVVYASVFGSVLAQIPALRTSLVAFDTDVVDLTSTLSDPVDVLFGVQLGGGTDIGAALGYLRTLVERPADTLAIIVSDLFDGGNTELLMARAAELLRSGVTVWVLLALSDQGAPAHHADNAQRLTELGATVMSATPDAFADLFAARLGEMRSARR